MSASLSIYVISCRAPPAGKPAKSEDEVKTWDTEFCKVDQGTLFELILVRTGYSHQPHAARPRQVDCRKL